MAGFCNQQRNESTLNGTEALLRLSGEGALCSVVTRQTISPFVVFPLLPDTTIQVDVLMKRAKF